MTLRTLTVDDSREREREVDRLVAEGYRVTDTADHATDLREKNRGSWLWHAVFLLFTLGIGNLIYAVKNYAVADRVRVIVEQ